MTVRLSAMRADECDDGAIEGDDGDDPGPGRTRLLRS